MTADAFTIESPSSERLKPLHWVILAASLVLFLFLRTRWVGHLLTWDEAMNLCTVRAFKAGGHDDFSNWFWRHPPLYCLIMLLLRPFEVGFAERTEILGILFGCANLVLLFTLNRRFLGLHVALWSIFFLACMPGSIFFDVWIKRDHPVATFGLLALLLAMSRHPVRAGFCLGIAFLFKESAIFFFGAVLLLWAVGATGKRSVSSFIGVSLTPVFTCGWWYLGVKPAIDSSATAGEQSILARLFSGISEHVRLAASSQTGWAHPWYYYGEQLLPHLGILLLVLCGCALVLLLVHRARAAQQPVLAWPLFILVPSYLLLSALRSKVPWVPMSLSPAWATLAAMGAAGILDSVARVIRRHSEHPYRNSRRLSVVISVVVALTAVLMVGGRDYETVLKSIDMGQWRGASMSREIAEGMNREVRDDERVLLTAFHYWKGLPPAHACPVFAYYFTRDAAVLIRPHDNSFEQHLADIREYELDWALLSPQPGPQEYAVFSGFIQQLALRPHSFRGALLFRTAGVYGNTATSSQESMP